MKGLDGITMGVVFILIIGIINISRFQISIKQDLDGWRITRMAMTQANLMVSHKYQDDFGIVDLGKLEISPQYGYEVSYGVYDPEQGEFVKTSENGLMGTVFEYVYIYAGGLKKGDFNLPTHSKYFTPSAKERSLLGIPKQELKEIQEEESEDIIETSKEIIRSNLIDQVYNTIQKTQISCLLTVINYMKTHGDATESEILPVLSENLDCNVERIISLYRIFGNSKEFYEALLMSSFYQTNNMLLPQVSPFLMSTYSAYLQNFAIYSLPIVYKEGSGNKYGLLIVVLTPKTYFSSVNTLSEISQENLPVLPDIYKDFLPSLNDFYFNLQETYENMEAS